MKNLLFAVFILSMSSCATIILGSKQPIGVSSTPSNATIFVNGKEVGQTPKSLNIKKMEAKSFDIRIELEGYKPFETVLSRKTSGWVAGNIVFGGLVGLIIDAATGSMYKLSPDEVNASLDGNAKLYESGSEIMIITTLTANPTWTKIGSLEKESGAMLD